MLCVEWNEDGSSRVECASKVDDVEGRHRRDEELLLLSVAPSLAAVLRWLRTMPTRYLPSVTLFGSHRQRPQQMLSASSAICRDIVSLSRVSFIA